MAYQIQGFGKISINRPQAASSAGLVMPADARLVVRNLHTHFRTQRGVIKAVDGVSFFLMPGRTLGIVGESGCGKSACAMSIMQLLDSGGYIAGGQVLLDGQDLTSYDAAQMRSVRGRQISAIFQEPLTSLNPVMTIGAQIREALHTHMRISKTDATAQSIRLLQDVRLPDAAQVMKKYPFMLSGGMRQRVMIAIALALRPAVLIADEPTTALDVTIQAQILHLMNDLQKVHGTSIIFITHNLGVVSQVAQSVAVMYCGQIVQMCETSTIFAPNSIKHPYTAGLLASSPGLLDTSARLHCIKGAVPHPLDLPQGCRFWPRCPRAAQKCKTSAPLLAEVERGHYVRCLYPQR